MFALIFIFMKQKKPFKFSLKAKTIIISLVLAIFVTEIAVAFYAIVISKRNNDTFNNIANSISAAAAAAAASDALALPASKPSSDPVAATYHR